ncbi:TetR/AcrR family transcriptional regulator [Micromonospora sp. DR5-3]|uniref:TetR/AcrR family transcriptional regulator n=1 Tax=unclassified Micromonospora TaxID=2617518 RepID=UPI0011D8E1FB|nr:MULTISPECIES: TetR/AcrR family transcriptional regulator [unclassified Micromonospora]MCW3820080.1 TetR/AcrR family transcriptional regulator [Micromonospora sp. DR5-3]TYC19896.1 TetR/AcrR family transcriptional regulator [Micromonospora sp. MP36]
MTSPPRGRALRADARRNRDAIVTTARELFGRAGVSASLDEIARCAGVGAGTLYRHFPTREDLVAAALVDNMAAMRERGTQLVASSDPFDAMRAWLVLLVEQISTYGGLPDAVLDAARQAGSALGTTCATMQQLTADLLRRAQHAGLVRDDVTAEDVFTLGNAIAWAVTRDRPADGGRHLVNLVIQGFRPADRAAA